MRIEEILDNPKITQRIFFPRKQEPIEETELRKNLRIEVDNGIILGGILYLHKNYYEFPTVLFFHGNGETAYDYQYLANNYLACGINLAVFDFRGYGISSGIPKLSKLFTDPLTLYRKFSSWMDKKYPGICGQTFFIMGRSLGSICASVIASKNPKKMQGLIVESGFGDTYRLLNEIFFIRIPEINRESIEPYSNNTFLHLVQKPSLVIHGEQDNIIPIDQGKNAFNNIPDSIKKEFISIPNVSHNNISENIELYYGSISKFIQTNK